MRMDGGKKILFQFEEEDDDEMTTKKMYGLNKCIQVIAGHCKIYTVPVDEG